MKKWMIIVLALVAIIVIGLPFMQGKSKYDRVLYVRVVELETEGGVLPFTLWYNNTPFTETGWDGNIHIGYVEKMRVVVSSPSWNPDDIVVSFPHYDSVLTLQGQPDGNMTGEWVKHRGGDEPARMTATARKSNVSDSSFEPIDTDTPPADFEGTWSVKFESSDELAIGDFWTMDLDENTVAFGTFLTTTGDYRFLAGRVDGNLLRLSTFDGAHAFLFHARMQEDGSIEGDFYSGNWHHETWTAVRDDDAKLPDAFKQTVIADEAALGEMVFKDLEGNPTRVLDMLDDSKAKARIIEVFGTWCPNCTDAGHELVSLKEKYGDDLAIVGLAFELIEDFDRSVEQVRRHHEHIGTNWPILIAGLNDKEQATKTLAVLDKVRSYPTLIFLNEDNKVAGVYTGFSGPATGDAYKEQRLRFEALIDGLIED